MTEEEKKMKEVFRIFVEGTLIQHDAQKSLSVIAEDVIGIGMGDQGIVSGKADLVRILSASKVDAAESVVTVSYDKIQIRCYEDRFGSICGVLNIRTLSGGETVKSSLGQMMSLRKEDGSWRIYAVQATPLFSEIEEMEAYPIKFAENALEKYRQQELLAKAAQKDSVAIYRVNFTEGIFEESVVKNDVVIRTQKGEQYEKAVFESAWKHLNEEDRYRFISTFSLGNILKVYGKGQTELSMEYEMMLSERRSVWMRTLIRLYMDKKDESLRGYMYVFDIDREKREQIELRRKAERDLMTDLYNKEYAKLRVEEKLKNISPAVQGAFLMIDLDHFKDVNDTYGHGEGDRVLKEAARRIKEQMQKGDIAGRLGGDEFCVYFHGEPDRGAILRKAGQICSGIRAILPAGKSGSSCSIGIVFCCDKPATFEEVYRKADQALYGHKEKGGDGYTVFKEKEDSHAPASDID